MEHEWSLRFAGQDAMNPVAEFMGERHDVVIRTQVIQKRERLRLVSRKHKRTIKGSAAFACGRRNVDALGRNEILNDAGERGAETFIRGKNRGDCLVIRHHRGIGERQRRIAIAPPESFLCRATRP